jgi:hypothetical protein
MNQRWEVHQLAPGGDVFVISRAVDGLYVRNLTSLRNNSGIAEQHSIQFLGNESSVCHDLRHIRYSTGESHRLGDSFRLLALTGE